MADLESMKAVADFAVKTYGSVDLLMNNSGLILFSYREDVPIDDWNKMVDVNIKGYLNGIAACCRR